MGDSCNRDNYLTNRASTRTFHGDANHHSKSSWSTGWGGEAAPVVSSNRFANGSNQNAGNVISDRSTTRLHAPPGGRSQVGNLIGGGGGVDTSQPISSNRFANGSNQNAGNVISERSSTRLHAPPGGRTQMSDLIGGNHQSMGSVEPVSSNKFANGSNQNAGNFISERSSTRLHAPPGGATQVGNLIGGESGSNMSQPISSNKFANGSNQNAGNVISERSSTRLHAPPGGRTQMSDLIGGNHQSMGSVEPVSSNKFANGSNQNAGNFISERPSTRLHAPPGGRASTNLWDTNEPLSTANRPSSRDESVPIVDKTNLLDQQQQSPVKRVGNQSSNAYANGSNQNAGNVLTDRPTTRIHAPPGGRSSITFG